MKITEDQLRKSYSQKETEDLLELQACGHLTNTAQLVLDEELRSRDVTEAEIEKYVIRKEEKTIQKNAILTEIASIERRFTAYFIDLLFPLLIFLPINYGAFMMFTQSTQEEISKGSLLLWLGYILFKDGFKGQSVGKRLFKIHVIEDSASLPCSLPKSFIRNITLWFGFFDWIFILGKKRKRMGDHFAGTSVVNQRVG